jgi:hypothetical protein
MPGRILSKLADISEKKIMSVDYPLKNGAIGSAAQANPRGTVYRPSGKIIQHLQAELIRHQLCFRPMPRTGNASISIEISRIQPHSHRL